MIGVDPNNDTNDISAAVLLPGVCFSKIIDQSNLLIWSNRVKQSGAGQSQHFITHDNN